MPDLLIAQSNPVSGARFDAGAGLRPAGSSTEGELVSSFDALLQAGLAATRQRAETPSDATPVGTTPDTAVAGLLGPSALETRTIDAGNGSASNTATASDAVTDLLALIGGADDAATSSPSTPGVTTGLATDLTAAVPQGAAAATSGRHVHPGGARTAAQGSLAQLGSGSNNDRAALGADSRPAAPDAASQSAPAEEQTTTSTTDARDVRGHDSGSASDETTTTATPNTGNLDPATPVSQVGGVPTDPALAAATAAMATRQQAEVQSTAQGIMASATASALRGLSPFPRGRDTATTPPAMHDAATGTAPRLGTTPEDALPGASAGKADGAHARNTPFEIGQGAPTPSAQNLDDPGSTGLAAQGATLASSTAPHGTGTPEGLTPPPLAAATIKPEGQIPDAGLRSAPTPVLHAQQPLGSQAWNQEFGTQVTFLVSRREPQAEIRLSPESLGPVQVRIGMQGDEVSVAFSAQQADTRAAIEAAMPQLRDMLAEHGLSLGQASVSAESYRNQDGQAQPEQTERHEPSGAAPDGTPEPAVLLRRSAIGLVDTFA